MPFSNNIFDGRRYIGRKNKIIHEKVEMGLKIVLESAAHYPKHPNIPDEVVFSSKFII